MVPVIKLKNPGDMDWFVEMQMAVYVNELGRVFTQTSIDILDEIDSCNYLISTHDLEEIESIFSMLSNIFCSDKAASIRFDRAFNWLQMTRQRENVSAVILLCSNGIFKQMVEVAHSISIIEKVTYVTE